MRVIDANTGQRLDKGVPFANVNGTFVILEMRAGLLRAQALMRKLAHHPDGPLCEGEPPVGSQRWVPLVVRYTHPAFFLQRVAFLPS